MPNATAGAYKKLLCLFSLSLSRPPNNFCCCSPCDSAINFMLFTYMRAPPSHMQRVLLYICCCRIFLLWLFCLNDLLFVGFFLFLLLLLFNETFVVFVLVNILGSQWVQITFTVAISLAEYILEVKYLICKCVRVCVCVFAGAISCGISLGAACAFAACLGWDFVVS